MEYKQVILIRQDLKLPKGKMAVQVAHASVDAVLKSRKDIVSNWRSVGMKKVVLKVADLDELQKYLRQANNSGLTTSLITDAGLTTVEPGTITCLAIGPDAEEKIDKITIHLKIF
jgi:PTH2 family peptidyl-tRNA hydrolase